MPIGYLCQWISYAVFAVVSVCVTVHGALHHAARHPAGKIAPCKGEIPRVQIEDAYYTGLRIGEVCGLTWQDINLE